MIAILYQTFIYTVIGLGCAVMAIVIFGLLLAGMVAMFEVDDQRGP